MTGPRALTRFQAIVMFVFVVLCFALLAVRTEIDARTIEHNRLDQQYQSCLASVKVLTQFDTFLHGLGAVELQGTKPSSPTYDKSATPTRLQRAAIYRAASIPIPDCSRLAR